jgi:hypothetical protein
VPLLVPCCNRVAENAAYGNMCVLLEECCWSALYPVVGLNWGVGRLCALVSRMTLVWIHVSVMSLG